MTVRVAMKRICHDGDAEVRYALTDVLCVFLLSVHPDECVCMCV